MAETYTETSERPIRELLSDLWENTGTLVRQELKLASAEVETKIEDAKKDIMKRAAGAGALYAGVLAIVAALVLFVAKFVALWVAALLVGVVVLGIGYTLLHAGKDVN